MAICKLCGKRIFNVLKPGGIQVSCDLGAVWFNESRADIHLLSIDGKIHKGMLCEKDAEGAMQGRVLHSETCTRIIELLEAQTKADRRREVPYAI